MNDAFLKDIKAQKRMIDRVIDDRIHAYEAALEKVEKIPYELNELYDKRRGYERVENQYDFNIELKE